MAEIHVKSPELKTRELETYKLTAQVTIGACVTESIDIGGLSVALTGTTACSNLTLTLSGFECVSDLALDSSRKAGIQILAAGTASGATDTEAASIRPKSGTIAGSAGSRTVAYLFANTVAASVVDSGTDSLTDAVIELTLPVKKKDF